MLLKAIEVAVSERYYIFSAFDAKNNIFVETSVPSNSKCTTEQ